MTDLKGTEKQVEAGTQKRTWMLSIVRGNADVLRKQLGGNAAALAMVDSLVAEIEAHDDASWWLGQSGNGAGLIKQTLVARKKAGLISDAEFETAREINRLSPA